MANRDLTNDAENPDLATVTKLTKIVVVESGALKEILYPDLVDRFFDTTQDHAYIIAVSELTADRTITLPLLTGNDTFVFQAHTQTLTNKRITRRQGSTASSATPTINTDNYDCYQITALAAAITSMTTNLSGTPTDGQELDLEILDNGTARAITWGASFASGPGVLPTTTTVSKILFVKLRYNSTRAKWICMAVGNEQ